MVIIEDITEPIGRAYHYYRTHPETFHAVNTALIYLGAHGLSTLAHNSGEHELERMLDASNIAATAGYAYHAVNSLLPSSLRGDAIKAAIAGLAAFSGLEEIRQYVHNYDAATTFQKAMEAVPFVWRKDLAGDLTKATLVGLGYVGLRGLRGIFRGARHHA